jgi:hypothetical protein
MKPVEFPEVNCKFRPPDDLDESQCGTIAAYRGRVEGGSVDGSEICVVAWEPNEVERALIANGSPVFISMVGGLAPHYPSCSFQEATHPA